MMKRLLTLVAVLCLMQGSIQSQIIMPVPCGSFEQWTSHTGYNVTMMGMNLPVYEDYSTPTGWNYLAYPVNESFSVYGTTISVNTLLPLIIASQETGALPDGNKAVKLQTFLLSDIMSGLVYVMAASQLDPTLTQTVFPSILTTGEVNIDSLMPLVSLVIANTDSLINLLTPFVSRDVNELITGGIALDGDVPLQLTGSYKYHSGESNDKGGVMMLGTRYNTSTQRREIVGGGFNIALTDASSYTPFTVEYLSLHELSPSFAEMTPDSLIIMLVSSAGQNRQQGSYLCVDNLNLLLDTTSVIEADSCARVLWIEAVNVVFDAFPEYVLEWLGSSQPDHWEVEYGPQGFEHGTGTMVTTNVSSFAIYELEEQGILQPNTYYDFYVRAVCEDSVFGEWDSIHYRTFCAKVSNLAVSSDSVAVNYDGLLEGYKITWTDTTDTQQWIVDYGITGSNNGSYAEVSEPQYNMPPLRPNTKYTVAVRSYCGDQNYGEGRWIYFTTATIGIDGIEAFSLSVCPNPADGRCTVTLPDNLDAELKLYSADGKLIKTIPAANGPTELQLPSKGIFLLQATTPTGTVTRKIVSR